MTLICTTLFSRVVPSSPCILWSEGSSSRAHGELFKQVCFPGLIRFRACCFGCAAAGVALRIRRHSLEYGADGCEIQRSDAWTASELLSWGTLDNYLENQEAHALVQELHESTRSYAPGSI